MPRRLKPVRVNSVLPPKCHAHGASNSVSWVHEGISHMFVKQPNPEAHWRMGNPTHPLHASFHLLSTQAPKTSRTKATLWIPGFHAFLTLETMHYPLWVQLYFPLSELIGNCIIIQTPSRVNAKILSG